jgi:glycosyltransferase involved in cell wall biosynthesis
MRLLLHIEKIHFKNRDTLFIVNCKKEKIALVKLYNVSPNRVYYIPNGHSLPVSIYSYKNRLKLRKKYNLGSKTCLLWVGYNAKRKGLYFFLDYLTRHPDIFGIVAGVSYEEAKKYGLINKNILVLNYYSQIHELFSIADIFYFPTEYEGGAKVVIEAMASGCCVVTTFESGGTDYIKDKLNGFIVKRDQTAMYTVLDDLLKNKRKIRSIGKRAKKSVKDCTWENSARERIKIYSKILKRKNLISVKKR